jgi:hypothetical protein
MTPAQQMESDAREATRKYVLLQNGWWKSPSLWMDKVSGKASLTIYWNRYSQCESNLIATGALELQSFHLQNFSKWHSIDGELRGKFPKAFIAIRTAFSEANMTVVAPPEVISALPSIIRDCDKP